MAQFKDRCSVAIKCLPESEYKNQLRKLTLEMLREIASLKFYKLNRACLGCRGEIHYCDCGEDKEHLIELD